MHRPSMGKVKAYSFIRGEQGILVWEKSSA